MQLTEAIEDLQARIDGEFNIKRVDHCEDMKLGIEALKRVEDSRRLDPLYPDTPLPGETPPE